MPIARVDGVDLYYEETGQGFPLVWCHEFGGDFRSWEPQVRYFSRRYRVVTWNYPGYPPSSVPDDPAAYRNESLVRDLRGLLEHLGIRRAHVGGLSMGGYVALTFGLAHADVAASLIICAAGSGAVDRERFLREARANVERYRAGGGPAKAEQLAALATRRGFAEKDPRGWAEFLRQASEHSGTGSALMLENHQIARPPVFELRAEVERLPMPTLVMVGDQDEPCLEPGLFMKRHIPHAGLAMLPASGHTINIEEPSLFNLHVAEFLAGVENGRWGTWRADKPFER
jgi:pimeloyl-ACP methyl ester carboxylesterase